MDKRKKKIVLFRPQPDKYGDFILTTPLSLLAVASPLYEEGYEIKIIDAIVDKDYINMVIDNLDESLCVGISAITGYQIFDGLRVAQRVKEKRPDVPVIWGGWHPTIIPEQTASDPYVDIVVRGQGEVTFQELIHALDEERPLTEVKGVTFKKDGQVVNTPDRPVEDINKFPPLPYHLIDVEKYIRPTDMGMRSIDYRTSQGCPFRCGFCADYLMSKRRWSGLSAERVVDEIERLIKNFNIDSVLFLENNFFVDKNRVKKICELILEKNIKIRWGNVNGRPEQLASFDDQMWRLLHEAGCHDILIGAESGSQEILDLINKQARVEDTIRLKKIASKYNIRLFVSLMAGFPCESADPQTFKKEFEQTLDLIDRLRDIDNNQLITISIYMPYPGTQLYQLALKCGMREPSSLKEWANIELTSIHTPWIPKKYEKVINQLNDYIFHYTTPYFDKEWERLYRGRFKWIKRLIHNIFQIMANFRLNHRFFYFPIEYKILRFRRRIKKGRAAVS